ncbi:hypothetical protein [Longitalea arenae]|uniref:hypothetical protein n=1 Tax=Longitalea arenae TaxID=2812558 RepID=UPI001967A46C|nr:hypothetical protein [Longitalea arenae]
MFKAGLTTIIGALIFQAGVQAQIYVKSPGNVGIGTQTPATKLHIEGVTTAGPANGGYHLIVNDIPNARWALGTGNYGFHIASDYPVTTTWEEKLVLTRDGNVGIGVAQPTAKLTLPNAGNESLRVGVNSNMANTHTQLINSMAVVADDHLTTSSCGAVACDYFNNNNNPTWRGTLLLHTGISVQGDKYGIGAGNQGTLLFQNENAGVIASNGAPIYIAPLNSPSATFTTDGKVGIGTSSPEKKLHVAGDVKANTYWAYNNAHWPDYVFETTYQLPSLPEIKNFINQHHHLPDVPSAEDVKRDGLDLAANQAIFLKKIEELTLYVIDQNEKLTELASENAALKEAVKELQTKRKTNK